MSFKAGNHLRFAEALVAISIYANAFAAFQANQGLPVTGLIDRKLISALQLG